MRYLFLFFILFSTAYATINAPMSNQFDNKGALSRADVEDILVKAGEAISAGEAVKYSTTADDGATVLKVSALTDHPACVALEDIASGKLGKCRIRGKMNADHSGFGDNAVAGAAVYPSNDALGGKVTGITSPAGSNYPIGVFLDASSATEEVEIFVQL